MLRRYGIWLFTQPRPLHDSRIWEADDDWRPLLTKFQRVIGIRRTDPGTRIGWTFAAALPSSGRSVSDVRSTNWRARRSLPITTWCNAPPS